MSNFLKNLIGKKLSKRSKANTRQERSGLNIETMERRDLMTGFIAGGNVVTITGTSASDTAEVRVDTRGTSDVCDDKLTVSLSHSGHSHSASLTMHTCTTVRQWIPEIRRVVTIPQITPRISSIVFNGHNGNDSMTNYSRLPMRANGGNGNDRLVGGVGSDTFTGGGGSDTLIGGGGYDRIVESRNSDFVLSNSSLRSTISGPTFNLVETDALFSIEAATITGGNGDNTIDATSFSGSTRLYGQGGADQLLGGRGSDFLDGGSGNDLLYGRRGRDTLVGGSGNDGLHGGLDVDNLTGGSGSDRFLDKTWTESHGFWPIRWTSREWQDRITDANWSLDARIGFEDGGQTTVDFAGQTGDYTYAAGNWADDEVELIDSGLNILHQATGNNRLLKKSNGGTILFIRHGALLNSDGGTFTAGAWNTGSTIAMPNAAFGSDNGVRGTVLHEIGHNWDTEYDRSGWRALSGWTTSNKSNDPNFVQGRDQDTNWWHLASAGFVSGYAMTNPNEDFSESFEDYFMNLGGYRTSDIIGGIANKDAFFASMVSDLS